MELPDYEIARGDRLASLAGTLTDAAGKAVDVTGSTLYFVMRRRGTKVRTVDMAEATLTNASAGRFSYPWAEGDTDTAGDYDARLIAVFPDGRRQSFPNPDFMLIRISEEL